MTSLLFIKCTNQNNAVDEDTNVYYVCVAKNKANGSYGNSFHPFCQKKLFFDSEISFQFVWDETTWTFIHFAFPHGKNQSLYNTEVDLKAYF